MTYDKLDVIALMFFGIMCFTSFILWCWNRDPENALDLKDLLMENGKLSRLAVTWVGSFMVMSFGFVHMMIHGTITDTYAGLYAGTWAIPIVTKLFANKPSDQSDK